MNHSFENIFDKYNISCEVSRKRSKSKRPWRQPRTPNNVSNTRKSSNFNTMRYKTLNITKNQSVLKRINSESPLISDGKCNSKENYNTTAINNKTMQNCLARKATTVDTDSSGHIIDCKKNILTQSFHIRQDKTKKTCKNQVYNQYLSYKQLNIMPIQKPVNLMGSSEGKLKHGTLDSSDNLLWEQTFRPSESSLLEPDIAESQTLNKQTVVDAPTELDLLIGLIEMEEKSSKIVEGCKESKKSFNNDNNPLRSKSCLKGGYEERLLKSLQREKIKSNFLKYDKKIGLRSGHLLTVFDIETYYGLTLATVKSKELNEKFAIVVTQEMASRLKLGTQIEAFFDDETVSYKLQLTGECLDVYLEPYKLLIV